MLFKRFLGLVAVVLILSAAVALHTRADAQTPATLADACTSLTPTSIQDVIDAIDASLGKAMSDEATNGTTGAYAIAATYNRQYLDAARTRFVDLQTWLRDNGLDSPYVTNTSAAYGVHGTVREAVYQLHHARHWATISAVYHTSYDARDSYELTSYALGLIEPLGADAGRCYMAAYFP